VKALAAQTAKATEESRPNLSMESATGIRCGLRKSDDDQPHLEIAQRSRGGRRAGRFNPESPATLRKAAQAHTGATNITNVNRGASETGSASSQYDIARALSNENNRLKLEVDKISDDGPCGLTKRELHLRLLRRQFHQGACSFYRVDTLTEPWKVRLILRPASAPLPMIVLRI